MLRRVREEGEYHERHPPEQAELEGRHDATSAFAVAVFPLRNDGPRIGAMADYWNKIPGSSAST